MFVKFRALCVLFKNDGKWGDYSPQMANESKIFACVSVMIQIKSAVRI